jgi:hypothetical protein
MAMQAMEEQEGVQATGDTFAKGVQFVATEGLLADILEDNPKVKELVGVRCGHFVLSGALTLPQVHIFSASTEYYSGLVM